jgi:hypothetical protein
MSSIPLHCNICPKNPTFSDLSHLLTHIGSKGHLAHYFKAQVRSRLEPSFRQQLADYDRWYDVNQIERLLSQRMTIKDSKDSGNNARSSGSSRLYNRVKREVKPLTSTQVKDEDVIDPQLAHEMFVQHPYRTSAFSPQFQNQHQPQSARMEAQMTPLNNKNNGRRKRRSAKREPARLPPLHNTEESEEDNYNVFSSPTKQYTNGAALRTSARLRDKHRRMIEMEERKQITVLEDESDDEELDGKIPESIRLKGIIWPGMDLFDSASPEGRRMRNQKKDSSIMELMLANSEDVQQIERIYEPGWELKMERIITGQVESSPPPESPKPKKQRVRRNQALADMSTNTLRASNRAQNKRQGLRGRRPTDSREDDDKHGLIPEYSLYQGNERSTRQRRRQVEADDELDEALTTGRHAGNGAKRVKVFQENQRSAKENNRPRIAEPEPAPTMAYPFLQHPRSNRQSYTPSHGLPLSNRENPAHHLPVPYPPLPSMHDFHLASSLYAHNNPGNNRNPYNPTAYQQNKENIEPRLNQNGRIESPSYPFGASPFASQRYFTMSGNQEPTFSSMMPSHMDFASMYAPQPVRQTINPLTFNFTQPLTPMRASPFQQLPKELKTPMTVSSLRFSMDGTQEDRTNEQKIQLDQAKDDSGDETIDEDLSQWTHARGDKEKA